jgi:hypothetical protein
VPLKSLSFLQGRVGGASAKGDYLRLNDNVERMIMSEKNHEVFLSYNSENRAVVEQLAIKDLA